MSIFLKSTLLSIFGIQFIFYLNISMMLNKILILMILIQCYYQSSNAMWPRQAFDVEKYLTTDGAIFFKFIFLQTLFRLGLFPEYRV